MADVATVTILGLLIDKISGPSKTISSSLGGVGTAATGLTSKLKGLIAGYISFQAISKAISEGREELLAQERLRAAVQGNATLIKSINDQATALSKATTQEDTKLVELAAQLINRGVGVDQVNNAMKAATNLAAALGTDVQTAGENLAITLQGIIPRGIGRAVPELKKLSQASLEAGGAIDVVNKKFAGFAEAQANTDVGMLAQGENASKEIIEQIGVKLIEFEGKLLPSIIILLNKVKDVVEGINTIADSPKLNMFVLRAYSLLSTGDSSELEKAAGTGVKLPSSKVKTQQETNQDLFKLSTDLAERTTKIEADGHQRSAADEKKLVTDTNDFLYKARVESLNQYIERKNAIESDDLRDEVVKQLEKEKGLREEFAAQSKAGNLDEAAKTYESILAVTSKRVELEQKLNDILSSQARATVLSQLDAEKDAAGQLNEKLQAIDALESKGSIGYFDALQQRSQAQAEYTNKVDESRVALKKLYDEATDPETRAAIEKVGQQLDQQAEKTTETFHTLADDLKSGLHDPVKGFFNDIITGAKSVKEAFSDMLKNIAAKLADFAAEQLTNQVLGALFGGLSGGLGGLFGGGAGGSASSIADAAGFIGNTGGTVPGSGPDRDSVFAYLTPGEFVMRRRAQQYYGTGTMHAINNMLIPPSVLRQFGSSVGVSGSHLNSGGSVSGEPSHSIVTAVVPPTEANMARLLRGGKGAVFDFLAENRTRLKGLVK